VVEVDDVDDDVDVAGDDVDVDAGALVVVTGIVVVVTAVVTTTAVVSTVVDDTVVSDGLHAEIANADIPATKKVPAHRSARLRTFEDIGVIMTASLAADPSGSGDPRHRHGSNTQPIRTPAGRSCSMNHSRPNACANISTGICRKKLESPI
jgi:hypothetical protein